MAKIRTIDEFRATKRRDEDLGAALSFDTPGGKVAGWIYDGALHIEDTTSWTAERGASPGRYYLLLDRLEFFADEIEPLETRLFGYWLAENDEALDEVINEALAAACLSIQTDMGVKTGDVAGAHFSANGVRFRTFAEVMAAYILAETMT
jgi:hypothetical protein